MPQNEASIRGTLIMLTGDVVAAHVSNNSVAVGDLPDLISKVHAAFLSITSKPEAEATSLPLVPAVSIRASVKRDYIVCLEDGKRMKMLKRYLAVQFGMTPDEYRAKWNLPADYPMVAPAYAERRSELAKTFGLGKGRRPKGTKDSARKTAAKTV